MRPKTLRAGLLLALAALVALLTWMTWPDPGLAPAPERAAPHSSRDAPAHRAAQDPGHDWPEPAAQPLVQSARGVPPPAASLPARIAGRVLRRGDDAPLDGVEIAVIAEDATLGESAIVATIGSQKGAFEVPADAVARQPHTLQFTWSSGWRWTPDTRPVSGVLSLGEIGRSSVATVRLDEVTTPLDALDVWLDTGWLVRGRVVDSEGHPVSHVQIDADVNRRDMRWLWPETDAQGCFLLGDLDPAQPLVLSLRHLYEPVERSRREIAPSRGGEVKDLGDLALPYRVREALR